LVRNTDKESEYFLIQRNLFFGKEFSLCRGFWLVTLNLKRSVNVRAAEAFLFENVEFGSLTMFGIRWMRGSRTI
jgi:hypothetical protein